MFQGPLSGDTGDGNVLVTQGDLSQVLAGYVSDSELAAVSTDVAQNAASIGAYVPARLLGVCWKTGK